METQEPLKWKPLEIEKVKRTKTITVVNRKVNNRVTENTDSEAGFSGSYFQFHPWLYGLTSWYLESTAFSSVHRDLLKTK